MSSRLLNGGNCQRAQTERPIIHTAQEYQLGGWQFDRGQEDRGPQQVGDDQRVYDCFPRTAE
jgi:hypothetical protein